MLTWNRKQAAFAVGLTLTCLLASVRAQREIEVNFQTESTGSCAEGLLQDVGEAYGPRGNGETYGWLDAGTLAPVDAAKNARDRGASIDNSCLFRTFIHMQYADCCSDNPSGGELSELAWRISLPNGNYRVTVLCGEPTNTDSYHAITANGRVIIEPRKPTELVPEVTGSNSVTVSDGTLTLLATRGTNTKLSHIRIESLSTEEECVPFPSVFDAQKISPLPCEDVKVLPPYALNFDGYGSGVTDVNGVSTGFTMYLPNSKKMSSYDAAKLRVADGKLFITSSKGRMNRSFNDHENALGVGMSLPDDDLSVSATFKIPTDVGRRYERACIFLAISDNDHVRLCYASTRRGDKVFVHYEADDNKINRRYRSITLDASREITLSMELYSLLDEVHFFYKVGSGPLKRHIIVSTGSTMFNKDAAGTDISLGTRSFAGVFTSHAYSSTSKLFELSAFSVNKIKRETTTVSASEIDFDTWYINNVPQATALRMAPNGRLYAALVNGDIMEFVIDHEGRQEISRRNFSPIGERLLLGLEVDPSSTASNVILWLSHSDAAQIEGQANTGVISKVSGTDFATVENVIYGLPRASANHAPNQVRFGPDGRLYIAVGGNTGGGVPNDYSSDFGTRPEQCFSAALLVADVKAPGFNGNCNPRQSAQDLDATGTAFLCEDDVSCDVKLFATGTRNPFDMEFFNGHLYMTDNGLGGLGTAPSLPDDYKFGDRCDGPVTGDRKSRLDPGRRHDLLFDVKEGAFYGHPNPARKECVFYGGNPTRFDDLPVDTTPVSEGGKYYMDFGKYPAGTEPDPNFQMPMFSLGRSHSANGIIAYRSDVFCGALKGDLLTTYYSQEDQVRRLVLNDDGTAVVHDETLSRTSEETGAARVLRNPLCIEQDPHGNIFIGEFFGNRIRVLDPIGGGCSVRMASADNSGPESIEHIAAAASGQHIYTFGGQDEVSVNDEIQQYSLQDGSWSRMSAKLPRKTSGAAAVSVDQDIVILGGKTTEKGVSADVHMFNPISAAFTPLEALPEPRAFASAVHRNGEILVLGGINSDHIPSSAVFAFNIEKQKWFTGPSLNQARFGASASIVDDKVYICGGESTEVLASCEMYDGEAWTMVPSMPSARRFAGAVTVSGKLLIKGGITANGKPSDVIEEYHPAARRWQKLGSLGVARGAGAFVRMGSATYSFGGRTSNTTGHTAPGERFFYL